MSVPIKQTLQAMVGLFKPEEAKGWDRVLQYEISGAGGGTWHVIVKDQKCTLNDGAHGKPDLKIMTDVDTWRAIVSGTLSATSAFMSGKLKTQGPMADVMKIGRVFPAR